MSRTVAVVLTFTVSVQIGIASAHGQCTTQPIPASPVEVAVPCAAEGCESCRQGRFPSLRIDGCSRVLLAWEDIPQGTTTQPVQNNIRFMRFDADGSRLPYQGGDCGSPLSQGGDTARNLLTDGPDRAKLERQSSASLSRRALDGPRAGRAGA
jgi:hypothetical protein